MMKGRVRTFALVIEIALGYWLGSSRFGADWRGMNVGGQESRQPAWWSSHVDTIQGELGKCCCASVSLVLPLYLYILAA